METVYSMYGLLGLFIAWLLSGIYTELTSPLRDVPGPWLARYTRIWYFYAVWNGDFHHVNVALHQKYARPGETHAPIVRIGPSMYSLAQPAKAVYAIGSKMTKSKWYEGWKHPSPDRWTLFTDRHLKRHAETRRKFQGLYSLSSLVTYERYVDECSSLFMERISARVGQGPLDLTRWFGYYAFDVIGDITYSKRLGFLDREADVAGIMAALEKSMVYSTLVGIYYWLHPFLYKIMENIPGSGAAARNHLIGFAQERVTEREESRRSLSKGNESSVAPEDAPRDFLDRIMDMRDEGKGVTDYNIFMLGLSNIIAGSDTTSITLSSIFYHLIRNPSTLEKLRQEIQDMEDQGKSQNGRVTFKESQEMPYLQACIKEALRMHLAVGLPLWRVVQEEGADICGRHFPAGSEVGINACVAHADKSVWGEDVHCFRPERWIDVKDEAHLKNMETHYLPFGLGARTCIGRHISYLEISKLAPLLAWQLDFELVNAKEWTARTFLFTKPVDFYVQLKHRRPHQATK